MIRVRRRRRATSVQVRQREDPLDALAAPDDAELVAPLLGPLVRHRGAVDPVESMNSRGWGIGLVFHARDVYWGDAFSEDQIRREMQHLR